MTAASTVSAHSNLVRGGTMDSKLASLRQP
jgi:hypothetical protein